MNAGLLTERHGPKLEQRWKCRCANTDAAEKPPSETSKSKHWFSIFCVFWMDKAAHLWAPPVDLDSLGDLLSPCLSASGLNLKFSHHILMSAVALKKGKSPEGRVSWTRWRPQTLEMRRASEPGSQRAQLKKKKQNQVECFFLFLALSLTLDTSHPRECVRLFLPESRGGAWVKPPLTTAAASSSHSSPLGGVWNSRFSQCHYDSRNEVINDCKKKLFVCLLTRKSPWLVGTTKQG